MPPTYTADTIPRGSRPTCLMLVGISPTRVGGMEILLHEVCRQLVARGWHPALALEATPGPLVREFFSDVEPVSFLVCPAQGGLQLRHPRAFWDMAGATRPDVAVYAFNGILRFFPWVMRLRGVRRIVYWDHSSKPIGYLPQPLPAWKRAAARGLTRPVSLVTAVAGFTGRCLAIQGTYPERGIEVIHNGVQLSTLESRGRGAEFRKRLGLAANHQLMTQVSWLIPEKGIDVFLQVARRVSNVRGDTHWAVVGDGPCRAEYEALARQLGLEDRVTFTGSISKPTENGVFEAAAVCCQFSQWEEACPLVVQEAHAAGRPIVASRVGGIPELIEDGVTGRLVDRNDVAGAAERILELLADPDGAARMGQAAQQRARSHFDIERNVGRLLDAWGAKAR